MNTVVLHPGALGDIILALPALATLRERFPATRITLAGNVDFISAVGRGHANRVASLSTLPLHQLYIPTGLEPEELRYWNQYDRIIAWTGFGDPAFVENARKLRAEVIVAGWRPGPGEVRHVSRIFLDSLRPLLGELPTPLSRVPEITVSPESQEDACAWLRRAGWPDGVNIVAVSPGAGSPQKRWPEASYRELIKRLLQKQSFRVLVITGPAEPGLGPSMIQGYAPGQVLLADSLHLELVSALLSHCCAHVGNDSGISHLAAGLGVPSVVLFGPSEPELWAPLGPRVEILRDTTACRACRRRSSASHQCLAAITPDLVMERIVAAVYGPANAPAKAGDKQQKTQSISIPPLASMHSPTR